MYVHQKYIEISGKRSVDVKIKTLGLTFGKNGYHLPSVSTRDVTFCDSILLQSLTKQDLLSGFTVPILDF